MPPSLAPMYIGNLELLVQAYNKLKQTLLEVEYPLIEDELRAVDEQLQAAAASLTWQDDCWGYIERVREATSELERRVERTQSNVRAIQQTMRAWAECTLLPRREHRREAAFTLEDKGDLFSKKYKLIQEDGCRIHSLVEENRKLLKANPSLDTWKIYVEFIDDIVVEGFFQAIMHDLDFFLMNTEKQLKPAPFFQAQMILMPPEILFKPSLEREAGDGFYDLVEEMLCNSFRMSAQMKRVAAHLEIANYQNDMDNMLGLAEVRQEIMNRVAGVISKVLDFRNSLDTYAYLWIDVYEALYVQMSKFDDFRVFDSWFKVDMKPFKVSLLNIIKKWSWMFQEHLLRFVIDSLNELQEFIKETDGGLQRELNEGDHDGLVDIMGHLLAVRSRQRATDELFEPLKETIALLETYGQKMPEQVYIQLEGKQAEFRERFRLYAPFGFHAENPYTVLDKIRTSTLLPDPMFLGQLGHQGKERYHGQCNHSTIIGPQNMIANEELEALEEEMLQMQESTRLFEVVLPEYRPMRQCRREIQLLKGLWDVVVSVQSSIDNWTKTQWRQINVEQMDVELRRFAKASSITVGYDDLSSSAPPPSIFPDLEIWSLDKEVRVWDAYTGLEGMVKDMATSLRAVKELQSPALRDRHWHQLMTAIGVTFSISEATTLADLLALRLHQMEDAVRSIVDKAVKELGTEKVITEISLTWATMEFSYEVHYRTGIPLLKSDEQLFETLEHNQVQLQTLLQSKYVEYFIEQVLSWQNKLNIADSVIFMWMEVQRTWSHLESIFVCSEDIRVQLVEDARRFDGVDAEFKVVIKCLKIADNVTRHLAKLFDSVADLQFEDDQDVGAHRAIGMFSKEKEYVPFQPCVNAEATVSETLAIELDRRDRPGGMCGPPNQKQCRPVTAYGCHHGSESTGVEMWLLQLEQTMQETVRHSITEAIAAYEEKPRELWIFDFPAQVALTSSQIWWTTDVGIAFSRLEEGYETALKDFHKKQLNALIALLLGELLPGDRQKVMTICTIDVHARDVVAKLISQKATFAWLSQLRHQWEDSRKHCFVHICDAQFQYFYEYLGNSPRLVITPLTDRCYITLTQSLRLTMSGAPAGPAGTGKTETTKDLGRALGMMVYVFNCSEQMDYKSIGNIYKGLVQTGAWGCFDEFNRISVEVLSVVAVQVKMIHDAIRHRRKRPCAMVAPDIELICEIMLVAEGFVDARALARKFITLYTLCRELLSKQVLMRALRDFNMPKIVTDDIPVFLGLVGDLFPALDVPRRRAPHLEQMVRQSTLELRLQPEESFILKVVQLEELLAVRHSVFVVGNAGTGKSQILRTLYRTYVNMKQKPIWNDLNPKAVTTDELFGLFSSILREQANLTQDGPKWIVLDGDIDPMWIESLNTVMDDNKVLTLASNERVALAPSMRLLFEIHHLRTATPATVSRAGVLYVNPQDLGWNPYVASWIDRRQHQSEKANLTILFDKYVPACLDKLRTSFKTITSIPESSLVQTICALLECLLTPENVPSDSPKEVYEVYFVFACVWAFGGTLLQDQLSGHQAEFSRWWHKEMKAVKFPSQGTIFDYYLDHNTNKFLPWTDKIPTFTMDPDVPLQRVLVHTAETTRLRYFMELLLEKGQPLMLVGYAGVGKTVFVGDMLASLSEDYVVSRVPFNYHTTYDRQKVMLKEIHNCQYVACMNPTVGSFTVNPRLQRHFTVFAFNFPSLDALNTIYSQILSFHFRQQAFGPSVLRSGPTLIQAAIAVHAMMAHHFLPTAVRFHYLFNMRDLSSIFQGVDIHVLLQQPLIYCHFASVKDWEGLKALLTETLDNYNELNAAMHLVLFEDAMHHVCRISRILRTPQGYALLIGVGGSGKQSLSRLAAHMCSLEVFQITLTQGFGVQELRVDLANLFIRTGAKNMPTVFLLTDAQVLDESFLVLINDLLASGDIPDLFSDEDVDKIISGIRGEVRGLGMVDSRENCWQFFLARVRLQLKEEDLGRLVSRNQSFLPKLKLMSYGPQVCHMPPLSHELEEPPTIGSVEKRINGSVHCHKMVAPNPLSPAGVAGTPHGRAHPQAGPAALHTCLHSPPVPSAPSHPGPAQGSGKPQMAAAQPPRASLRLRRPGAWESTVPSPDLHRAASSDFLPGERLTSGNTAHWSFRSHDQLDDVNAIKRNPQAKGSY
ncbi:hypothetical protein QTO34_004418 [Cnephaeus nilssonii]|uniref:Dynein heavy chain 11, axonemal n=1 Tax=Cnephaeus nilssonii TaxID=3371016 RepID=A0AA40LJR9_CNENI|nr:hypothetical protein QTO34_004418 [Eptesicus nilssonii]